MNKASFLLVYVLPAAMAMLPGCKNHVPGGAGVPSGPGFGRTNGLLYFKSSAIDPDGNNVRIRFDWGDGRKSGWLDPVRSGDTTTGSNRWGDADVYLVRAQARDSRGAESDWSDPCSLRIEDNFEPWDPFVELLETALPGEAVCLTAYLSDPDEDSVALRVSWGDGTSSDWTGFIPSGEATTIYHTWADTGRYSVAAQALDQYGMTSECDTSWTILVWQPKWRYRTGGAIEGCPAVADNGVVYCGSDDGCLYALDQGGALMWRYHTGAAVKSSPALAADGTLYVGSNDGGLYAIDANGTLKWRYQTGDSVSSSPALAADGTVYFASEDGFLYAVNPSGALKWSRGAGGRVRSSPAVSADGSVYLAAGRDTGFLYAFAPDGAEKWRRAVGHTQSSPAIAADGTVYVGSSSLLAFDPTGTLKWSCQTEGDITTSPVVGPEGTVYVGAEEWGCLYAIDHNGTITWYEYVDGLLSSFGLAADGTVYVPAGGCLWGAVGPNVDLKWGYKIGDEIRSSPAIATDGTVYIGSDDGYLYAIEGNSPLADAPWPKFHHDARNSGRVGGR